MCLQMYCCCPLVVMLPCSNWCITSIHKYPRWCYRKRITLMYSATWNKFNSNNVSLSGIVLSVLSMLIRSLICNKVCQNFDFYTSYLVSYMNSILFFVKFSFLTIFKTHCIKQYKWVRDNHTCTPHYVEAINAKKWDDMKLMP